MQDWLSIVLALGGSTLCGLIVTTIWNKIAKHNRKIQELQDEKKTNELIATIKENNKPIEEKIDLIALGTQATLRNDLLNCYYACDKKGYKTNEDIQNFADMYEAYHNLHGNSFIEQTAKIFAKLPTEEEFKRIHKGE